MTPRRIACGAVITFWLCLAASPVALAQTVQAPSSVFGSSSQSNQSGESSNSSGQSKQSGAKAQQSRKNGAGPRASWKSPHYGGAIKRPARLPDSLPPFGANLFEGGFSGTKADGLNADYHIKPGDQVTLRIWGAAEMSRDLAVDAQGNIFIPQIGPLQVQGVTSSQLNGRVRQAINKVYTEDVQVYTNLKGVQPVGVFVTGYVDKPGRYAGTPSDSLLYFLNQAGGIDDKQGSYRQIEIHRDGKVIAHADLYNFLLKGKIPRVQFKTGDTIVVAERGPGIAVTGDVQRSYRYELKHEHATGSTIVKLAQLKAGVSHVLLRGGRRAGPFARYLGLDDFREQTLKSGDEVEFNADRRSDTIVVKLGGSFNGPSRYALPRDARLGELLDAVSVPRSRTAVRSVSIKRESVARQQKKALKESLRRLQNTYLSASSQTDAGAEIRAKEADLIKNFVQNARQIEPSGRLVVARDGKIRDIRLHDHDKIIIPQKSDSVLLSGEIVVPQAVVYRSDMSARNYIHAAGGFTDRANEDKILVVRQNGAVRRASNISLRSGDEIMVLPEAPTKHLQVAKSISQILFQVAVTAGTALRL